MSDSFSIVVNGDEQEIDLDQIANFDASDVEVTYGGFQRTPACVAQWELGTGTLGTKGDYAVFSIPMVCRRCFAITSDEYNKMSFVGYEHTEDIFIKDLSADVGRLKGLLKNSGYEGKGSPTKIMQEAAGLQMVAKITHSRNKNDPDNPYVNMDYKGVKTVDKFMASLAD